jgi:hypothetical protein
MLENLYGKSLVYDEAKAVGVALKYAAGRETAHPDDREGWTPENPTYGHCDLFTDYCRRIWGKTNAFHWNNEAKILVWWAYASHDAFLAGSQKNKLTVHYSFFHPGFGEIDLSRNQFPDGTYLHPRPKPLSHVIPVSRSWNHSSEIPKRRKLFEPEFASYLLNLSLPSELTPELSRFLDELQHAGYR